MSTSSSGIGFSLTKSRSELEKAIAEATVHNASNELVHSVRMFLNTHTFEAVGFKELTLLTRTCKVLRRDFLMKIDRRLRAVRENLFATTLAIALKPGHLNSDALIKLALEMAKDDPEKALVFARSILLETKLADYLTIVRSIAPKLAAINSSEFLPALQILAIVRYSSENYLYLACDDIAVDLAKQPLTEEPAKIALEKRFRDEEKPILVANETDEMRLQIEVLPSISAQRAIRYALAPRDNERPVETHFNESDKILLKVALSLLSSQTTPDAAMTAACFIQSSEIQIYVIKIIIDETPENNLSLLEQYAIEPLRGRQRDEVLMHLAKKAVKTNPTYAKKLGRQIHDENLRKSTFVHIATFLLKDRSEEAHSLFRTLGTIEWNIAKEFIDEACKYDLEAYRAMALQTTNPPDPNNLLRAFGVNIAKVDIERAIVIAAMPELTNGLIRTWDVVEFPSYILLAGVVELAKTDPDRAESYLPQISDNNIRKTALRFIDEQRAHIAQEAVKLDVKKAEMLADPVWDRDRREGVYRRIVSKLVKTDLTEALRVATKISGEHAKKDAQFDIGNEIAKSSVVQAVPFILASATKNAADDTTNFRLRNAAEDLAKADITKALELAGHIDNPSLYAETVAAIWSSCTRQNLPRVDATGLSLGYGQFLLEE